MSRVIFLIIFGFIVNSASSQTFAQLLQMGDESFMNQEYVAAVDYYSQAARKNSGFAELNFRLAESYRMLRDYRQAIPLYKEVIRDMEEDFPMARYWYAELMKSSGEYEKAAAAYRAFIRKNRSLPEFQHQLMIATHEVEVCSNWVAQPPDHSTFSEITSFEFNHPQNDFNPVYLRDSSLIYSVLYADTTQSNRYRFAALKLNANSARPDTLFQDEQYSYTFTAGLLPQEVWFAACPINATPGVCKLYHGTLSGNGIQHAVQLPEAINLPAANQRQPMLSMQNGELWLYFASDRPGGFGGYDLYRSKIISGTPQNPENLGSAVNSPVDELCPFYYAPENALFFSSTWFNSLGGFDIFKSAFSNGKFESPQNLGNPINSPQDELYYQLCFFEAKGWFTSNRSNGKKDYPACCADIYSFQSAASLPDSILALRINRKKEKEITDVLRQVMEIPPFDLYFDNDEPDPQSRDSVTSADYPSLFQNYINRKEQYQRQYAAAYPGNQADEAASRIDSFFTYDLQQGMNELAPFLEKLAYLIENDCAVEIYLESFASPLNKSDYNLLLSKRRIHSLLNYFDTVFDGSLDQAMHEGRLQIFVKALGDSQADANVSADLQDTAHSVYSPEAARERRISIVSVKVNRIFTPAKSLQND